MGILKNEESKCGPKWTLPVSAVTRDGVVFDPRAELWSYVDGTKSIYINFSKLVGIEDELLWSLKKTLIWFAENKAPGTLSSSFDELCRFVSAIDPCRNEALKTITAVDFINGRTVLREKYKTEGCIRKCRPFFRKLVKLGYTGISPCGQKYLKELKLKASGNGSATTLLDPIDGPFTDIEREEILDALCAGYAAGIIPIERYVLAWLIALFGQRPKQYALLKLCDFVVIQTGDCIRNVLRMPLVKSEDEVNRSRFQEFDLIPELAALIVEYKANVKREFVGLLSDTELAPFFPSKSLRGAANIGGLAYHTTAVTITDELRRTYSRLDVISERTGEQINFNVYRFRRTVGTNCIREGLGAMATAMRLGHTTASSVRKYFFLAAAFELHDRIEFSTAARLGTIAQVFKGVLVTVEHDKDRITASHILSPVIDSTMKRPMGSCGKQGYCAFNKPIACYTCILFRAWLDGPHQEVYDYLEADKQRLVNSGCADAIVRINDRTMIAVASVIDKCKEEYARRALGDLPL